MQMRIALLLLLKSRGSVLGVDGSVFGCSS